MLAVELNTYLSLIAKEITKVNHEATRLTEHLTVLRRTSQTLSDSFYKIKSETDSKYKERSKGREEKVAKLRQSILQAEQDLEVREEGNSIISYCSTEKAENH